MRVIVAFDVVKEFQARVGGVFYSRSHVSRRLKILAWTPQRPMERASQRDEAAIEA